MAIQIDPTRIAAARQAYDADMAANHPELRDNDGKVTSTDPFFQGSDGQTYFSNFANTENKASAQNRYTTQDVVTDKGIKKQRQAAWKEVPNFYTTLATGQSKNISGDLERLQEVGSNRMTELFNRTINRIG